MIIDADIVAYDFMVDFNGPSRFYPNPQYPSGVSTEDNNVYKFGPESSPYPNLTLPCNLYDQDGNEIPYGFYMVKLSDDLKYLELFQSNVLIARVRVIKLVEKMYTNEELMEEGEIIKRIEEAKAKKKLKKLKQAEEDLVAFKERSSANSYAEILDSKEGYYLIKYRHDGKTATGIIQK